VSAESPKHLFHDFDRLDIVALTMVEGFGPATVRDQLAVIRSNGQPIDWTLPRGAFKSARAAAASRVAIATRIGARCILDGEPDYPDSLLALENPPVALWVIGDISLVREQRCVSIVGTRDCTSYGERVTREIAVAFARAGVTVVSGMALGIDAMAHRAALETGGRTAAVLGTGVDVPYPAAHRSLHRQIGQRGVIISEGSPGQKAAPGCFPRRNRLIAALGEATIVVEAGVKSGALNTADWVQGMDRKLGAIPGPIDSPQSLGSNMLMRDGAHPITGVAEALSLLDLSEPRPRDVVLRSPDEESVWKALAAPASDFDVLCARTGLPARICIETVSVLELRGLVECSLTGEFRRR
jgi:DNA processing protein